MKTIQQRLQSRISRRRNFIRQEEVRLYVLKGMRASTRDFCKLHGLDMPPNLTIQINDARADLKALADDQRLDKKIKSVIAEQDSMRRFYDIPALLA